MWSNTKFLLIWSCVKCYSNKDLWVLDKFAKDFSVRHRHYRERNPSTTDQSGDIPFEIDKSKLTSAP